MFGLSITGKGFRFIIQCIKGDRNKSFYMRKSSICWGVAFLRVELFDGLGRWAEFEVFRMTDLEASL
jgi:hypothetical protein